MADRKQKPGFPKPIASLLAEAFRGKPLEKRLGEAEVWRVWEAAVGPQIAARARPSKFHDGVLTVVVASAPWMQQLSFMKRDIAERLNGRIGKNLVREIYLKAGRPPRPEERHPAERPAARLLSETEESKIEAAVSVISDAELRQAFSDLIRKQLSRTPEKK